MQSQFYFAPHLAIQIVRDAVEYYIKAFNAKLLRKFDNPDGSIHVAEMEIGGAMFHIHEVTIRNNQISPHSVNGTTVVIGLFVPDPAAVVDQAVNAGGTILDKVQDFDYGYRQGIIVDPFGHQWLIQCRI